MRSRPRRHTAPLALVAAAALVVVVVAGWTALRPAASERNPVPEPIRIVTESGPAPDPTVAPTRPDAPAPADPAPRERVPADVVPPPPLPDDDDDGDDQDDGGGDDDDGGDDD